jgi:hypothetical protein
MNNQIVEQKIAYLSDAFSMLDWKEPCAHEVYRELLEAMNRIITDITKVSWNQFHFWELGAYYGAARRNFETIPPLNHKDSIKEEKVNGST